MTTSLEPYPNKLLLIIIYFFTELKISEIFYKIISEKKVFLENNKALKICRF